MLFAIVNFGLLDHITFLLGTQSKTLLFYYDLSNLAITPKAQPYLPYNLPDKTSESGRILEQN
jgi:hypothetical protein